MILLFFMKYMKFGRYKPNTPPHRKNQKFHSFELLKTKKVFRRWNNHWANLKRKHTEKHFLTCYSQYSAYVGHNPVE